MSGSPHDFAADAFHAGQLYRSCFRELTESCGFTPNEMFVLLNDRRLVHLHLSDEGHAAAKELHHRCETFALTLQQGISEQEMQTLCSVMQKMQRNLNDLLERTKLT